MMEKRTNYDNKKANERYFKKQIENMIEVNMKIM